MYLKTYAIRTQRCSNCLFLVNTHCVFYRTEELSTITEPNSHICNVWKDDNEYILVFRCNSLSDCDDSIFVDAQCRCNTPLSNHTCPNLVLTPIDKSILTSTKGDFLKAKNINNT